MRSGRVTLRRSIAFFTGSLPCSRTASSVGSVLEPELVDRPRHHEGTANDQGMGGYVVVVTFHQAVGIVVGHVQGTSAMLKHEQARRRPIAPLGSRQVDEASARQTKVQSAISRQPRLRISRSSLTSRMIS